MFKKTPPTQTDMFRDLGSHLSPRKSSILDDPTSWHNVFLREVTQRVDEVVFEPIFNKGGRPNAPLRILLGMMVLKEGNGWSDEQLFDNCRFNIRCMRALGLCNIDDDVPVESTYYEFRRRLAEHNDRCGEDLVGKAFRCATRGQIRTYNIKGEKIRMDSKLIQSNIAKAGRLELILETLRVSISNLELGLLRGTLDKADIEFLRSLRLKTASNVAYPLDNSQKKRMLERLGHIIKELLPHCSGDGTLARLYREQYREIPEDGNSDEKDSGNPREKMVPEPREAKHLPTDSLQSVHDPEAAFRRKGQGKSKQQVSGYHANVTETFGENNPFELLTDVRTVAANVCEDAFLLQAIEGSDQVLGRSETVGHVTTDGGYDSRANRKAMAGANTPYWNMANHKGMPLRYQLAFDEEGSLTAYCKRTKTSCKVAFSKKAGKYVIHHGDGSKRYMTEVQIAEYVQLQAHLSSLDPNDINIRPNVESTIHQMFHKLLKRDKVKYRGKYKCSMYVFSRAYWTNFRRILKNQVEMALCMLLFQLCQKKGRQEWPRTGFSY